MLADLLYALRTWVAVRLLRVARRVAPRDVHLRLSVGPVALPVGAEVHHPEPLPGVSLLAMLRGVGFRRGESVLELGTGAGAWALLAADAGARVTATDVPGVPLAGLVEAAARVGADVSARSGDLFAPVAGQRFDTVLFNPPFHDGEPAAGEASWVGGALVRRFLAELPAHLADEGRAVVVLPRAEQARYAAELAPWRVRRLAGRWFPVLGRVELLELRPGGDGRLRASAPARAWARLAELGETRSCELVRLAGRLDPARLAAAAAHLVTLHPLLEARWEQGHWRLGAAPLRLRVVEGAGLLTRDRLVEATWDDGDPDAVDLTLLRGETEDWLRMRVPHARTDARAGAQVVQDLADSYGALEAGTPLPARADPAPWEPSRLFRASWRDTLGALGRLGQDLLAPLSTVAPLTAPRGRIHAAILDTPADTLAALKRTAAATGTTVHARLVEAAAACFGVSRIFDLVTLRPLAVAPVDTRCDVLVVPWILDLPRGGATGDTLAAIRAQVHTIKHGGARAELARLGLYDRLAGLLPTPRAAALTFRRLVKADVIVTNPGPVHVPLAAFGSVPVADFVNYPRLVAPARAGLVFTTFRGHLRVVALWDDAVFPAGIAAQVAEVLARAAGGAADRGAA